MSRGSSEGNLIYPEKDTENVLRGSITLAGSWSARGSGKMPQAPATRNNSTEVENHRANKAITRGLKLLKEKLEDWDSQMRKRKEKQSSPKFLNNPRMR